MSDNGGECKSHPFIHGMHKLGVTLTTAPSYQPQRNGMSECYVGLMNRSAKASRVKAVKADSTHG
eukprot:3113619-Amphidinium_carterae.2